MQNKLTPKKEKEARKGKGEELIREECKDEAGFHEAITQIVQSYVRSESTRFRLQIKKTQNTY